MKKEEEKEKKAINERVKLIRDKLELTQVELAAKLFVTHGLISAIELGKSKLKGQTIQLICTPNQLKIGITVNEEWFRTGKGEMFITPAKADGVPKLYDDEGKELPADEEELIGVYRDLIPDNKKYIRDTAKNIRTSQENMRKYMETVEEEEGKKDRRTDTSKKMN